MKSLLFIPIGIMLVLSAIPVTVQAQPDQDSANCDAADTTFNPSGNNRGNQKQCSDADQDKGPKEPFRDCYPTTENDEPRPELHKNALKDNNEDGDGGCKNRGNND